MTRFKELRRVEAAIAHHDEKELDWAESYCKMRLRVAPNRRAEKHWEKLLRKVDAGRDGD